MTPQPVARPHLRVDGGWDLLHAEYLRGVPRGRLAAGGVRRRLRRVRKLHPNYFMCGSITIRSLYTPAPAGCRTARWATGCEQRAHSSPTAEDTSLHIHVPADGLARLASHGLCHRSALPRAADGAALQPAIDRARCDGRSGTFRQRGRAAQAARKAAW